MRGRDRKPAGPQIDFDALAADPDWIEMTDARARKRVFFNLKTRKTVKER